MHDISEQLGFHIFISEAPCKCTGHIAGVPITSHLHKLPPLLSESGEGEVNLKDLPKRRSNVLAREHCVHDAALYHGNVLPHAPRCAGVRTVLPCVLEFIPTQGQGCFCPSMGLRRRQSLKSLATDLLEIIGRKKGRYCQGKD